MERPIAIYVRVSSKSQDTASQDAELQRWADSQTAPITWYRDKASGTKMQRPAIDRLMAAIRAGTVSKLVLWRLDRLGRTCAGLVQLFDELRERKVGLFSLRDSLDLETPAGRLMANVLASVAAYETEVRRERQQAGIAAAQASGKSWGGSKPGRRRISREQQELILRLHREGTKVAEISRATCVSRPTVYAIVAEGQE